MKKSSLQHIFEPASIAVIGASRDPKALGYQILHNLIKYQYTGTVYPVNPAAGSIHSVKAYPSVLDIPGEVEMAVIVVPKGLVPHVLEDCGKKGIKGVVVISAGFKETGEEGARMELELVEICKRYGMRMIGPNCMGVTNVSPSMRMNATFGPLVPPFGHVGFISQSGAMGIAVLDYADDLNLGMSKFVSIGNKADIAVNDLLEYFETDDETKVILLYIESLGDPLRAIHIAKRISKKKPIIVVKAGKTARGASAALSHTGALMASDTAFDALFKKSGMIRVSSVADLFNLALGFSNQPLPSGNRVAILTNGGGPGILATDACIGLGLEMATLSDKTIRTLKKNLASEASVKNPVDMIASANKRTYEICSKALLDDPNVDALISICTPPENMDPIEIALAISKVSEGTLKPVLGVFMGRDDVQDAIMSLNANRIPIYQFTESAAYALSEMYRYKLWRDQKEGGPKRFTVDKKRAEAVLSKAEKGGRTQLTLTEAQDVLEAYGFDFPKSRLVQDIGQALDAAAELGYPVVLKVVSPFILHKTEANGVMVDIQDAQALHDAYKRMSASVAAYLKKNGIKDGRAVWGYLIQAMADSGKELIIGSKYNPLFGPIIMVGMGGIYVEVMQDVSFGIPPISDAEAKEMMTALKGYPILHGVRGEKGCDMGIIEEYILRLSQLVADLPQIRELDLNPVRTYPPGKRPIALDARIIIGESEAH